MIYGLYRLCVHDRAATKEKLEYNHDYVHRVITLRLKENYGRWNLQFQYLGQVFVSVRYGTPTKIIVINLTAKQNKKKDKYKLKQSNSLSHCTKMKH